MDQNLHDLIHALHEAEKWIEKVKSIVDNIVVQDEQKEREDRYP